jgi:hypothetical protein
LTNTPRARQEGPRPKPDEKIVNKRRKEKENIGEKLMKRYYVIAIAAVVLLLGISPAFAQRTHSYRFTSIANLQDYGGYFEPATITNRGDVLFAPALLTGGEGVLLWRKGTLTTIAAGGQVMPDGGILGYTLSPVAMNEDGEVAFIMTRNYLDLLSPLGLNAGAYRYSARSGVVPVMVPGLQGHGGNSFWGSSFVSSINDRGDIVFPAMLCTTVAGSVQTIGCPDGSASVLALGDYKADKRGRVRPVVVPGDPAPGGQSYFDLAHGPNINARGDVAFTGHVYGEVCGNAGVLVCADSVYVKRSPSGVIEQIASFGAPSPVSGRNYAAAFSPVLNAVGDVAFVADLSSQANGSEVAVFLYTRGKTIVIAKPGDSMPGGGTFASGGDYTENVSMNNPGDIVFVATLTDGTNGIYVWHHGTVALVAKTGTDTGAGIISTLDDFGGGAGNTQVPINDAGQIVFSAKFQGGGGALLVATPK